MGQVTADVTVSNVFDEVRLEDGELAPDGVRTVSLERVMVDTGANMLCLPSDLISRLGLRKLREVTAVTAAGERATSIYRGASLTVNGRTGTFEVLETPGGAMPLLGVLPLESLGIELDLQNQRLVLLPERGDGTYISVLEMLA
jgi:clan AA aspartic protease